MKKKDIYKIDNWLVNIGRILFIIFSITTCSRLTTQNSAWISPAIGLFIAIGFLTAGYIIRRREKQIIVIWNILEHSTEVSAQELMQHTGFDSIFIEDALRLINNQGQAYYLWDKEHDKIIDGRLRTTVVTELVCEGCGAKIHKNMRLDANKIPSCHYCGQTISDKKINQLKSDAIDKIRAENTLQQPEKRFSWWIFILLLIFFWPAGIAYIVWKSYI